MYLLSLGEKLLSFCLARSATSDEAHGLSRGMATGVEDVLELVPKTGSTCDACGHCSNFNVFASFLFEVLSSVTDRVSDKAVEIHGTCSHGLPSAG